MFVPPKKSIPFNPIEQQCAELTRLAAELRRDHKRAANHDWRTLNNLLHNLIEVREEMLISELHLRLDQVLKEHT